MEDVNYDALLVMLPPNVRAWVVLALQFSGALIAALTVLLPALEKLAALTASKRDDQALSAVQRVLSMFPRVQVPALSQRPPAPATAPVKLEVTNFPLIDRTGAAKSDDVSRAVVLPPSGDSTKSG